MKLRRLFTVFLAGTFQTAFAFADVVHVRDYPSREPRDRGVVFALAVTPEQDVLSFVAKGNGNWRLTRIRGWLDAQPKEQTIEVPGWPVKKASAGDSEFLALAYAAVFVTPDGRYAVCVATGQWARQGQGGIRADSLVSSVDLRTFVIVKSIRTSDIGREGWRFFMNPPGYLTLLAETPAAGDLARQPRVSSGNGSPGSESAPLQSWLRLAVLSLPDLSVQAQCRYSETGRGDNRAVKDAGGACGGALGRIGEGPVSVGRFVEGLEDAAGFGLPAEAGSRPCPVTGITRDRLFEKESCEKYHLSAWNRSHVTDRLTENVLSLETAKPVGTVEETTRNSVHSQFAEHNGHDYLLVMEGGTGLKVYEIRP